MIGFLLHQSSCCSEVVRLFVSLLLWKKVWTYLLRIIVETIVPDQVEIRNKVRFRLVSTALDVPEHSGQVHRFSDDCRSGYDL
jgi:hypothetical protein